LTIVLFSKVEKDSKYYDDISILCMYLFNCQFQIAASPFIGFLLLVVLLDFV